MTKKKKKKQKKRTTIISARTVFPRPRLSRPVKPPLRADASAPCFMHKPATRRARERERERERGRERESGSVRRWPKSEPMRLRDVTMAVFWALLCYLALVPRGGRHWHHRQHRHRPRHR